MVFVTKYWDWEIERLLELKNDYDAGSIENYDDYEELLQELERRGIEF